MAVKGQFVQGSNAVVGADEFARKLRKMNADLYKELAAHNRKIAKYVQDDARARASTNRQADRIKTGVRGYGSARQATLQLKELPKPRAHVYGSEFGAVQYHQFRPWTGNQWTPQMWGESGGPGYFFFPAINQSRDEVMSLYELAVAQAARKAGISTFGGPRRVGVLDVAANTL